MYNDVLKKVINIKMHKTEMSTKENVVLYSCTINTKPLLGHQLNFRAFSADFINFKLKI